MSFAQQRDQRGRQNKNKKIYKDIVLFPNSVNIVAQLKWKTWVSVDLGDGGEVGGGWRG